MAGLVTKKRFSVGGFGPIPDLIEAKYKKGGVKYTTKGTLNGTVVRTESYDEAFSGVEVTVSPTKRAIEHLQRIYSSPNNHSFTGSLSDNDDLVEDFVNVGIENFADEMIGSDNFTIMFTADPLIKK